MNNSIITNTVTDLYTSNKLNFRRGYYNIIDCGVRTGKTYWAMNNLIDFTRDRQLRRILFLVDTTALKDNLIINYPAQCCDADELWRRTDNEWSLEDYNKIGVMCYQALGARVIKNDLEFLDSIDVICWDECDSIFDFAATAFAKARKTDFSRKTSTNGEILALIQEHSSKREYMPLILLGQWEKIIYGSRILCIGLTATPERARMYYDSLVSASNQGKLETTFRAASDIYFKDVIDHIHNLLPIPGHGYWCYSPSIQHNLAIVAAAKEQGFNPIELHSTNNNDYPLTDEQRRVINSIEGLGMVPFEYDFVVVTRFMERGIGIQDTRFTNLIVDSYLQEDRQQAARQLFPYQRHVKVLATSVPEEFLHRWLTVSECRELAEYMAVPDIDITNTAAGRTQARIMSWNKLQNTLPKFGYIVEKKRKRINGAPVQAYYIAGEWHDVEVVGGKDFMDLVAAKSNEDLLKLEGE